VGHASRKPWNLTCGMLADIIALLNHAPYSCAQMRTDMHNAMCMVSAVKEGAEFSRLVGRNGKVE